MNFFAKYKNITVTVVIAILLYLGYSYFFGGVSAPSNIVTETANPAQSEVGGDLLQTLLTLRSLTLNEGIFTDKVFVSLRDFSQPITPLPVGRKNPFAPFTAAATNQKAGTTR